METTGPVNHVFVDFENVHAVDLAVIAQKSVSFTLLVGAKQKQLKVELVEQLLRHAASVQLVRLDASGKNALDFTLAYYVGRAVAGDPSGFFHVVSKDKGFDPLIAHLRTRHVKAHRHDDFSTLNFQPALKPKPANAPAPPAASEPTAPVADDRTTELEDHLRRNPSNRPKRRQTLVRHVVALFGRHHLDDPAAEELIDRLRQRGRIAIDAKGAVSYAMPPPPARNG